MAWYPDWVVALHEVSKGTDHATITQQNAQDIISEIEKLQNLLAEVQEHVRGTA